MRFIFLLIVFLVENQSYGQRPEEVTFSFRFFDNQGKVVTPDSRNSFIDIKIDQRAACSPDPTAFVHKDGYYTGSFVSWVTAEALRCKILIRFTCQGDTMNLETTRSHDSIPFAKGNFLIPYEYRMIFDVTPFEDVNVPDWTNFKVKQFSDTIHFTHLQTESISIRDNFETSEQTLSSVYFKGVLYDPQFSRTIYAWAFNSSIYKSIDEGKNWKRIYLDTSNSAHKEIYNLAYKDKNTIVLSANDGHKPIIYFSGDEGNSWQMDTALTDRKIFFIHWLSDGTGVAFADDSVSKTKVLKSTDGKKWEPCRLEDIILPSAKNHLLKDVKDKLFTDYSLEKYANYGKYYKYSFDYVHSLRVKANTNVMFDFYSEKALFRSIDKGVSWKKLLRISDQVKITFNSKVCCILASDYILVSKDQGQSWVYYPNNHFGDPAYLQLRRRNYITSCPLVLLDDHTLLVMINPGGSKIIRLK